VLDMEQLVKSGQPKTLNEAVDILCDVLSKEDKLTLSSMAKGDLIDLHFGLGLAIRNAFDLHSGNAELLNSFSMIHSDDVSMAILEALWERLR